MTGIDTNVLVRYLVWDDEQQARKAERYIEQAIKTDRKCFINLVVLCEMVWVLESAYKFKRDEISSVIEMMLKTKQFEIEKTDVVKRALKEYKNGKADFADCIIGLVNNEYGCNTTITLDKKLRSKPYFKVL